MTLEHESTRHSAKRVLLCLLSVMVRLHGSRCIAYHKACNDNHRNYPVDRYYYLFSIHYNRCRIFLWWQVARRDTDGETVRLNDLHFSSFVANTNASSRAVAIASWLWVTPWCWRFSPCINCEVCFHRTFDKICDTYDVILGTGVFRGLCHQQKFGGAILNVSYFIFRIP